jgi:hypothetical protein
MTHIDLLSISPPLLGLFGLGARREDAPLAGHFSM